LNSSESSGVSGSHFALDDTSRVVRLRPILLTASAAMLSSIPIVFDPIFKGLGWSLMFGLFAATLITLFVIHVTYWLVFAGRTSHSTHIREQGQRTICTSPTPRK
jgi:hypothetical protein